MAPKNQDKDEDGKEMNPFAETLSIMTIEDLIRFRARLQKVGRKRMVEILSDEIKEREALEEAERQRRTKELIREREEALSHSPKKSGKR